MSTSPRHLRFQSNRRRRPQDLEEEIGVNLCKRSPRGITPTAEGRLFLDLATSFFNHCESEPVIFVRQEGN
jgi:DNA-binding transcriptional LysR family regulator